jgi:hypothetical protein
MKKYFYTDGVNKFGPFTFDELKCQNITRTSKVWYYGLDYWIEIDKLEELKEILITIPPELKSKNITPSQTVLDDKNNHLTNSVKSLFKIKKPKVNKWIVAVLVITFIALVFFIVFKKQSDANLRNEIIANSYSTDEKFDIYINKFYRDLNYYGIFPKKPNVIIIKFSKLDQLDNTTHIHGLTFGNNDDNRIEIYINPSSWKKFTRPMRYFLMYHELAHDILNLDDLSANPNNEGRLMYPAISSYDKKIMDEFIESFQALFKEQAKIK